MFRPELALRKWALSHQQTHPRAGTRAHALRESARPIPRRLGGRKHQTYATLS